MRQRNQLHADGASAIHSADVRSGFANVSFFVNDVLRVRFFTCTSTVSAATTFTDVVITSPGSTFRFLTVTDASGTSSYQA